ncbi:MAG: FkbM family methyltransferase [Candidatus Lokiarchaeota archaeon]|nr:FkbM family methyltransferase [Candidatus Lokiarchaeota archaeon]
MNARAIITNLYRRLKVILLYIKYKKQYTWVRFAELVYYLGYPVLYLFKVRQHIAKLQPGKAYTKVFFSNHRDPLYWPADLDIWSLFDVSAEIFDPRNWHHYEVPETQVAPGDVVLDCGAAEGLFSFTIKDKAKAVYLIEPIERFIGVLRKTFADDPHCHVLPIAVGNQPSEGFIRHDGKNSRISTTGGERITIDTIDRLFHDKGIAVNYIKADLEGYELMMLLGAVQTIKKNKPKIAITTYHSGQDHLPIIRLVKQLVPGYKVRMKGMGETMGKPIMCHFWV